jgi:hypothetical protein
MSIVLVGSTSGSVTLQEPAVAGTTVLTLPAVTGTVLTDTSPKAGNVIQVVSANYSTSTSTTSGSFTDTGLTASITPTSSSSKILAIACISAVYKNSSNSSVGLNIVRGATEIVKFADNGLSYTNSTGASQTSATMNYLDSPTTTSSTTYKVQFKNGANTGTSVVINDSNVTSTLTLMEIAA